jgi:hypothetical protein
MSPDTVGVPQVSPIIRNNSALFHDIITGKSLQSHIQTMEGQVKAMHAAVKQENRHFWPALLSPGHHLTARPLHYSSGSESEMQLALQYNYKAWEETPGAIEMIRKMMGTS